MEISTRVIEAGGVFIGGNRPLVLIAGPCVIESRQMLEETAMALKELCASLNIPFIFKSSYDKANRTSSNAFRGPGLRDGLEMLAHLKETLQVPILVDVHAVEEVASAAAVADILQVPAFLCRQTDLVHAVARSGVAVNIKKGQFLAPWDVKNIIDKATAAGGTRIIVTERGSSFGYNNLVNDMRALPIMRRFGFPVVFDATHSVQLPGGMGKCTGGQREFVPFLSRAAVATGCDGLFLEAHLDPDRARCDAANQIPLPQVQSILEECRDIDRLVNKRC